MATALRCFWGLSLSLSLFYIHSISTSHVYIVYLGHVRHSDHSPTSHHHLHLLATVFHSNEEATEAMLHSYKHSFSGFSATLNASQASILRNTRGVISVFRSKTMQLHTTRSWDFMGLTLDYGGGTPLQLTHGEDIIVGVFDSGVWPESPSFREEPGMGPVPKHWRGACDEGEQFSTKKHCNKKLIGARWYRKGFDTMYRDINKTESPEYKSARDVLGHGTHTASIAAGSRVSNASLFGFARGVARGGAPRARIAVYKVCWNYKGDSMCTEADMLQAFDQALHDGVHVITVSIGRPPPLRSVLRASAGIGSFHAMQLGVSVVFSAGNSGPDLSTVENVYPWSISVAASSVDRSFTTEILCDDGSSFVGEGFVSKRISGGLARTRDYFLNGICNTDANNQNTTTTKSAAGLILLCFSRSGEGSSSQDAAEVAAAQIKAAALIFVQPLTRPVAALSIIPLVRIDILQATKLGRLNITKLSILASETEFRRSAAPVVADYSSRGPSSISPEFLKPDISAPGVNILAAWSPKSPPSGYWNLDTRSVLWNFDSGTSMACPHVAGLVALLNSAYPHWSPAAIRSAIITTAYNTDIFGDGIAVQASEKSADPFDIGAGHMNPLKACDPGLIYDTTTRDYVKFLCNIGYSEDAIESMLMCPQPITCPERPEPNWDINYPSISVPSLSCDTTVTRTVRNVGRFKTAVYYATVVKPYGVEVAVWPRVLVFSPFKEEITYYVRLSPVRVSRGRYEFGSITWSDGFHHVRSPLVVQINSTALLASLSSLNSAESLCTIHAHAD